MDERDLHAEETLPRRDVDQLGTLAFQTRQLAREVVDLVGDVAGPAGRARTEIVWAALDCPGGIAAAEAAGLDTSILLGRMTARLAGRPEAGQPCRVIAWPAGRDGRKLTAFSALLGPGGEVLAAARAVWLTMAQPPSGGAS